MAEDAGNAKWEQLQAMRSRRDGTPPKAADADEPTAPLQNRDPDTGKFVKAADPAAVQAEQAKLEAAADTPPTPPIAATSEPPAPVPPTPPTAEEIEIEGYGKVSVDPSLAAAMRKAEAEKATVTKDAERAALKEELAAELRAELAPKPKTEAELAAEKALADAQAKLAEPKPPDGKLAIDDPEEYTRQMTAYAGEVAKKAKNEAVAEITARNAEQTKQTQAQQIQHARNVLNAQFYDAYPILRDSKILVDKILDAQFDAIFASGKIGQLKTAEEGEALKKAEFADAAAKATKEIVKIMAAGKKVAPPAPPPPTLVASAPTKQAAPPKAEEPKTRERYPKGSVSASLAEVRQRKLVANQ